MLRTLERIGSQGQKRIAQTRPGRRRKIREAGAPGTLEISVGLVDHKGLRLACEKGLRFEKRTLAARCALFAVLMARRIR